MVPCPSPLQRGTHDTSASYSHMEGGRCWLVIACDTAVAVALREALTGMRAVCAICGIPQRVD